MALERLWQCSCDCVPEPDCLIVPDLDMTYLPSGEKATELTKPLWPSSVCSGAPVDVSQSQTVLLSDLDTTYLPLGERATELTGSLWPLSVCSSAPVATS